MRFALIALFLSVCSVALAQDGQPASVLNHGQPAAAVAETTAPAPAVVVAAAEPVVCANGTCTARSRTRFRTVTEGCDACTGQSVRSVTRGVVRGTSEVASVVGSSAVNVVTAPVRACRNVCRGARRACCCR
jgi:hypothetical protein